MPADNPFGLDGTNEPPLKRKKLSGPRPTSKPTPKTSPNFTVEHRPKAHIQPQPVRAPPPKHSAPATGSQRPREFIDLTNDDGYSSSEDVETKRRDQLQRFGLNEPKVEARVNKAELPQPQKSRPDHATRPSLATHSGTTLPSVRFIELNPGDAPLKRKRGRPANPVVSVEPRQKRPRGRPRNTYHVDEVGVSSQISSRNVARSSEQWFSNDWRPKGTINIPASVSWMKRYAKHPLVKQLDVFSPPTTIVNNVDQDGPPENFVIIKKYEYTKGTTPLDPNARYGCSCRNCETRSCDCLADCAEDEHGMPLGFPYASSGLREGCLLDKYLDQRHVIYECNELCDCGSKCRNKVVKRGRRVPLEIFKTHDRGWGLRCHKDLRAGEFVEVYLGEIITDAEARRRERLAAKNSYLFTLDKFQRPDADASTLYVVDGEKRGSVARFINHCCDPNLRVFAVSHDRGDPRVYQLAFFASEYILAGTELTFDYLDRDCEDYEDEFGNPILSQGDHSGLKECHCGAPNCRKWLWQ